MIEGLEPIPLRDLQALGAPKVWSVDGKLEDLESLTPVPVSYTHLTLPTICSV